MPPYVMTTILVTSFFAGVNATLRSSDVGTLAVQDLSDDLCHHCKHLTLDHNEVREKITETLGDIDMFDGVPAAAVEEIVNILVDANKV